MGFELLVVFASRIVESTFLVASIFNLLFTQKSFKRPFEKVQNRIGIIYLFHSIFYILALVIIEIKYANSSHNAFEMLGYSNLKIIVWSIPFIISIANAFKKLRTSKIFVLLSIVLLLLYETVFFESPKEPISVYNFYDNSTIQTFINGVILYFLIIFIFKRKKKK